MKGLNLLYAFLGGAVVGAGAALLFAPEKGDDLRKQIKDLLHRYCPCKKAQKEDLEEIVERIAAEIEEK